MPRPDAGATGFVLPSDHEGLSLALPDAMGAGPCVQASHVPENREVVEGAGFTFQCGIFGRPRRSAALSDGQSGGARSGRPGGKKNNIYYRFLHLSAMRGTRPFRRARASTSGGRMASTGRISSCGARQRRPSTAAATVWTGMREKGVRKESILAAVRVAPVIRGWRAFWRLRKCSHPGRPSRNQKGTSTAKIPAFERRTELIPPFFITINCLSCVARGEGQSPGRVDLNLCEIPFLSPGARDSSGPTSFCSG
jgi:hypothetical protein